jgi:hypothetical protein
MMLQFCNNQLGLKEGTWFQAVNEIFRILRVSGDKRTVCNSDISSSGFGSRMTLHTFRKQRRKLDQINLYDKRLKENWCRLTTTAAIPIKVYQSLLNYRVVTQLRVASDNTGCGKPAVQPSHWKPLFRFLS